MNSDSKVRPLGFQGKTRTKNVNSLFFHGKSTRAPDPVVTRSLHSNALPDSFLGFANRSADPHSRFTFSSSTFIFTVFSASANRLRLLARCFPRAKNQSGTSFEREERVTTRSRAVVERFSKTSVPNRKPRRRRLKEFRAVCGFGGHCPRVSTTFRANRCQWRSESSCGVFEVSKRTLCTMI